MPNKGYETITSDEDDDKDSSHPSMSANCLSLLSFWWINNVFKIGSKRPLKQSDFLPLHEKDRTRDLTEQLQREWNTHVQECNMTEGKQPRLWKCVLRTISRKEVLFLITFFLVESVCRVSQPLVLGFVLRLISCPQRNRTLANAFCLLLSLSGLSTALTHYSAYRFELLGMRLSSAIKGIVYLKVRAGNCLSAKNWCILIKKLTNSSCSYNIVSHCLSPDAGKRLRRFAVQVSFAGARHNPHLLRASTLIHWI